MHFSQVLIAFLLLFGGSHMVQKTQQILSANETFIPIDHSSISARIFNRKNFCMNQKLPAGYGGFSDITMGKVFMFTVPVNFTPSCGADNGFSGNICEQVLCNNECMICGRPLSQPPLDDDKSLRFNMSGLFNRATFASLAGTKIGSPDTYQHELGGLACNFTFDSDVDRLCTVTCVAKNIHASFHDIWRWTVTVVGPTTSRNSLYVDMGAYLNIRFLAGDHLDEPPRVSFLSVYEMSRTISDSEVSGPGIGKCEIVLSRSILEVSSPLNLVAGDYLTFSVAFYDAYGNSVGFNTTGQPTPTTWKWFWSFTGTSPLGVASLNSRGLAPVTPTESDGKLMLSVLTGKSGYYTLMLGKGNESPQGAPIHFSVKAGLLSISNSTCEISARLIPAGTPVVIKVTLVDVYGNMVDTTNQTVKDFMDGTKLLDFYLYQIIPPLSFVPGSGNLTISFVPLIAKSFHLKIGSPVSQIAGSPFAFQATPGAVSAADSLGYITENTYIASDYRLTVYITQVDVHKNLVSTTMDSPVWTCYFQRIGNQQERILPSFIVIPSYSKLYQTGTVQIVLVTIPTKVDQYLLYVTTLNENKLTSCPFTITILPGKISMTKSVAVYDSRGPFPPGSLVTLKVVLLDEFGNIVTVTPIMKALDFRWKAVISRIDGTFVSMPLLTMLMGSDGSQKISFIAPNISNVNYKLHIGSSEADFSFSPLDLPTSESPSFYVPACIGVLATSKGAAGSTFHLYVTIADQYGNRLALTAERLDQIAKMFSFSQYPNTWPLLQVPGLYVHGYSARPDNLQYYGRVFIEFVPQVAGQYFVQVQWLKESVSGSPFLFTVFAGGISATASTGFWHNGVHTFTPGDEAILKIQPVDRFGNNVSFSTGVLRPSLNFSAQILEPLPRTVPVIVYPPYDSSGYFTVSFFPVVPGDKFHLQVGSGGQFVGGSPFLFSVNIGAVSVPNCTGAFVPQDAEYTAGSHVNFTISQGDQFGNPVYMLANSTDYFKFTASMYKVVDDSEIPVKIVDLKIRPSASSSAMTDSQTLTFTILEAGNLILSVADLDGNVVYGSPFPFTCRPGPLNLTSTLIQGPGIRDTFAGDVATFQVQFEDSHGNPTDNSASIILIVTLFRIDPGGKTEQGGVHVLEVPGSFGLYNVTYASYKTGLYVIEITALDTTNTSLVMRPRTFNKTVLAGPIYAPSCVASGSGLQGGVAGVLLNFSVSLHDLYNNGYPAGVLNVTFVPASINAGVKVAYGSGQALVQYMVEKIPDTGSLILMHVMTGSNQTGSSATSTTFIPAEIPLSPFKVEIQAGPVSIQDCTGLWLNGQNQFTAGNQGRLLIFQRDRYGNIVSAFYGYSKFAHKVLNTVTNVQINTSSTVQVTYYGSLGQGAQLITITFIEPGNYIIEVGSVDNPFVPILGSPFTFSFNSGILHLPTCDGVWLNKTSIIIAGNEAQFIITTRDVWGNVLVNVPPNSFDVKVARRDSPQTYLNLPSLEMQRFGSSSLGQILVRFSVVDRGEYLLYIGNRTAGISGSPFTFSLAAGDVDVKASFVTGEGLSSLASVTLSNDIVVHLLDSFGNGISGKVTVLSLNVTGPGKVVGNKFDDLTDGLYGASYVTNSVGMHSVVIQYLGENLPGSPFSVDVALSGGIRASYCIADISPSTTHVQPGQATFVTIHVYDATHSSMSSSTALQFDVEIMPHPKSGPSNSSANLQTGVAGTYLATLGITEAGSYTLLITLFGTNIGGGPYGLIVDSGGWAVSTSVASGTGLQNQVAGAGNSIAVQLCDQYGNVITTTTDELYPSSFSVDVIEDSSVVYTLNLDPQGNGTYSGTVDWTRSGSYIIRIYSGTEQIKDSPFSVTISPGKVKHTMVSPCHIRLGVSEEKGYPDAQLTNAGPVLVAACIGVGSGLTTAIAQRAESIWVQLKDQFGNSASDNRDEQGNAVAFSFAIADNGQQPNQFGRLANGLYFAQYVVFADGQYELSIKSGNLHISSSPFTVHVTSNYVQEPQASPVNCTSYDKLNASTALRSPYILSMPSALTVLEGRTVPLQGGIPCMEVGNGEQSFQLSVRLTALHGLLYLVPSMEELWQAVVPLSEALAPVGEEAASETLAFSGTIPAINSALQAIQYAGTSHYNGRDALSLQVFNPTGVALTGDTITVQVDVGAVNDPPYILTQPTIIATWVFGIVQGISVGDPDQFDVRADKKVLMLQVCLTVDVGQISLNVTSSKGLNASTYNGRTWLPIPSAGDGKTMNISGKGICFTASVDDCNTALGSSLVWNPEGSESNGNLNVSVNDLGNFGCSGDCSRSTSVVPLRDSAAIQLLQGRKPAVRGRSGLIIGSVVGLFGGLVVLLVILFLCRRNIKLCGLLEVYITRRLEKVLGIDSTALNPPVESQVYKPSWILAPHKEPLKFRFGEFTGDDSAVELSQTALEQLWSESLPAKQTGDRDSDDDDETNSWDSASGAVSVTADENEEGKQVPVKAVEAVANEDAAERAAQRARDVLAFFAATQNSQSEQASPGVVH